MLRGQKGLVPSNMVELVTDPEKLENIPQLLADQLSRSPGVCLFVCLYVCVCVCLCLYNVNVCLQC